MKIRLPVFAMFGTCGAALAFAASLSLSVTSRADPPTLMGPTLLSLQTFHTARIIGPGYMDIDADARRMTVDLARFKKKYGDSQRLARVEPVRLLWKDDELWYDDLEQEPMQLPSVYADRVGQVFDELRAGAPNLVFTPGSPLDLDSTWQPREPNNPGTWFKVGTPWSWDHDYRVYVQFLGNAQYGGNLARFSVWHIAEARPMVLLGHTLDGVLIGWNEQTFDVPLDPNGLSPEVPPNWEQLYPRSRMGQSLWYNPQYHDLIRRVFLEPSPVSTHDSDVDIVRHCADDGVGETLVEMDIRWVIPPSERARATAALAECPEVRFTAGMEVSVNAQPHQQACIVGQWQVLNTGTNPPTVISSEDTTLCRTGTSFRQGGVEEYLMSHVVPPGSNLSTLAVRWVGDASITCSAAQGAEGPLGWGTAVLLFSGRGSFLGENGRPSTPMLGWDCFPGWEP